MPETRREQPQHHDTPREEALPDTTSSDAAGPEATTPAATLADAASPEAASPDVTATDVTAPEAATTDVTAPEAAATDVTVPDAVLREETPADHDAVRALISAAFGDEHATTLADALRAAPAPLAPQAFVAECDGRVVGHVMLSASRLDAPRRLVDVLVLSPLAVLPEYQGLGIGTRLVHRAVAAADERGVPLLFLEGSPRYYGARGFERADELGFRSPSLRIPPVAFQVALLTSYQPWMTGTLVYAETFWALDCVGLRTEP